MGDFKLTTANGLIEATIKMKQETYYLVTDDNLSSLKQKSLLNDLFVLITSLCWGAFFSVMITLNSIPFDPMSTNQELTVFQPLETLSNVFLGAGILFSLLTILMYVFSYNQIRNIEKGKIKIDPPANEE